MKKHFTLFTLMLTALFSNITASALERTSYISDVHTNVTVGGQGVYTDVTFCYMDDRGVEGLYDYFFYYSTEDCRVSVVKDILLVSCDKSVNQFTYNGLTYSKTITSGDLDIAGNLNYGTKAPGMFLFIAKGKAAVGDKVLTKLEVEILDNAQTDDYVKVMTYSNGMVTPRGDDDIRKGAGGKYVYVRPTYTTLTEASYPMMYEEEPTYGTGTEADPYQLSTTGHLYWFSYMVANGNANICGKLTADITVNEGVLNEDDTFSGKTDLKPWYPIGLDDKHPFKGKLMGDGYTIRGLYCDDGDRGYVGLVGYASSRATISRLGLEDCYFKGNSYVGGVCGYLKDSSIGCCYVRSFIGANSYGGGICGGIDESDVKDCYVLGQYTVNASKRLDPICGGGIGNCDNCYYDGDHYEARFTGIGKPLADFASGKVASLLNHGVETGEEPFHQHIGTDMAPKLNASEMYYVFKTTDGGYTNQCPHHDKMVYDLKPATCISEGHIPYFYCGHPVCQSNYVETASTQKTTLDKLTTHRVGDIKPVIVNDYENYRWNNTDTKFVNSSAYYGVMELELAQSSSCNRTYSLRYPIWPLLNGAKIFLQIDMRGFAQGKSTLKFLVNKVERTEWRQVVNHGNAFETTIMPEGISTNDQLEIDLVVEEVRATSYYNRANVLVGMDKLVEETSAAHSSLTLVPGDDCLHEGLAVHYQCERCGSLFKVDEEDPFAFDYEANLTSDMNVVSEADLYHAAHESHLYAFRAQENGLYADFCNRCNHIDKESWVAKEAIGGEDLLLTGSDEEGFSTFEPLTLQYGEDYTVPVPFATERLTYTVPVYANSWSSWSVPFEVSTEGLAEAGFDAAYIEGIHRYDTDDDGTIDRTTLEVIRIKNGTLRAGTPYLIHPQGDETSLTLSIDGATLHKASELHPINTATALASYDFVPTYVTVPAEEAKENYYIIGAESKLGPTTSYVSAIDWYLKITDKGSPFDALQGTHSIGIRVVGEEDETTGIFTPYAPDEQTEEIYDLSGRRLDTVPAQGLYIQGNEVKMGK